VTGRFRTPAERRELKRKGNANRLASVGALVADAIRTGMNVVNVVESKTTSNAPLITLYTMDDLAFNVTVTRARK
jgi:hypothetical protein